MKIKYLKLKNWLLATLAPIFGITVSCDNPVMNAAAEYGCPSATYQVKGCVTDEENNPLEGITVDMVYATTKTDSEGKYLIQNNVFPDEKDFDLSFKDEDGDDNGSYADTTVQISFKDVPYVDGDGRWYRGTATVQRDIKMRHK